MSPRFSQNNFPKKDWVFGCNCTPCHKS
jgi:hypothetical protein